MSVSEDKVAGEEVGRLKAKDPDLGDNGLVNYRLIDGDGINMFELTTDSETREAVIKLKKVRKERKKLSNLKLHFLPWIWSIRWKLLIYLNYFAISLDPN